MTNLRARQIEFRHSQQRIIKASVAPTFKSSNIVRPLWRGAFLSCPT